MNSIPFRQKDIRQSHQGRALPGVVVQGQQLESRIIRCTQRPFNLMFVAQGLQLAGGHHELVRHSAHVIVVQYIAEYLEVFGFVHPRVLTDFIEIREYAPLSGLVGDERHTHRVIFARKSDMLSGARRRHSSNPRTPAFTWYMLLGCQAQPPPTDAPVYT